MFSRHLSCRFYAEFRVLCVIWAGYMYTWHVHSTPFLDALWGSCLPTRLLDNGEYIVLSFVICWSLRMCVPKCPLLMASQDSKPAFVGIKFITVQFKWLLHPLLVHVHVYTQVIAVGGRCALWRFGPEPCARRAIACGNSIAVFYYVLIIIATNTNTDLAILSRHTTYSTWVDVMSLMCKVELWYMRTCTVHVHQLKDTRRLQVHGIWRCYVRRGASLRWSSCIPVPHFDPSVFIDILELSFKQFVFRR